MMTRVLPATPDTIAEAARVIRSGGIVGMPTETVYGLAGNALDAEAVRSIFVAKGRPTDNPLICHIADIADLSQLVTAVSPLARKLMDAFWPGPLTLLLPALPGVPVETRGGSALVGVRLPSHPVARALVRASGVPLAAPSANTSGHASPTTAAHVLADLGGHIPLILDGGPCEVGLESTVVEANGDTPVIARLGGITLEDIRRITAALPRLSLAAHGAAAPLSPGQKYRHYGIAKDIILTPDIVASARSLDAGQVTLLAFDEDVATLTALGHAPLLLGPRADTATHAQRLFALLRAAEGLPGSSVLIPELPGTGIAEATRERLGKSAGR